MKLKEFVENNKDLTLIKDICLYFTYRKYGEPYTINTLALKGYYGDYDHTSGMSNEEYLKIFEDRELFDAYAYDDALLVEIVPNDFEKELIMNETIDKQNPNKKLNNEDEE